MSEFYQVDYNRKSPEAQQWEKLNFVLRQIFNIIKNIHGEEGPVKFYSPIQMTAHAITGGPLQKNLTATDYVTKSYLSSVEAGNIYLDLLKSKGKTPLPIPTNGGGGVTDHALLSHLDYAQALHTGFVPAIRQVSSNSPLSGGGNLGSDLTLSITKATAAVDGYLSSTDWATFNGKQNALGFGNLTEATSSVLTVSGGTGAVVGGGTSIQVKQGGAGQSGYLSSGDWSTFNGKVGGSGTAGNIPKFTAAGTIGDSVIKESSNKIGIATTGAPTYTLEVQGQVKATTGSILPTVVAMSDASPLATDGSAGNHFRVTLGANRILGNPTNGVDGQRIIWEFTQDATGNRTLTLDTKFSVPQNMPDITLSTGPGKTDMLGAIYNAVLDRFVITGFMKEYA
jgi:hypothetical protein